MALRRLLKVPQYGLFYFESDKTISVVPTKNIRKVLSGDNKSKGSVVEVDYAGVIVKAEILATNDDPSALHQAEVEFLRDPKNEHLFEANPQEKESAPKNKTKQTAKKGKTKAGPSKNKEPKKSKDKELATVVAVFSPRQEKTAPRSRPMCSTPLHSSNTPLAAFSPCVRVREISYRSTALASSFGSSSLSPKRLSYSLFGGHVPSESLMSSPPYLPSFSSLVSPDRSMTDHENLRPILERIEWKLDRLLERRTYQTPLPAPQSPALRRNTDLHVSPADETEIPGILATPAPTPDEGDQLHVEPAVMRGLAASHMNFSVRLLRKMCPVEELKGKNIAGLRGKQPVDPVTVARIKSLVLQYYPVPPTERTAMWRACCKSMDAYLRRLNTRNA